MSSNTLPELNLESVDVSRAVATSVQRMKVSKTRLSVRGLYRDVLMEIGFTSYETSLAMNSYVVDYRTPIGVSVRDYVETLVHKTIREWNHE